MKDNDNISIKSRSMNYNSEKKNEAKQKFERPNFRPGQFLRPGQNLG